VRFSDYSQNLILRLVAIKDVTPEVAVRLGSLDSNDRSIEFLLDVVLTDKKGMLGCGYGSHFNKASKHATEQ
jgi:hypothetical protein